MGWAVIDNITIFVTMGNEGSSFQPHAAVSKQEIEKLQKSFGQQPSAKLGKSWTDLFDSEVIIRIEKSLHNKNGLITFHSYQQLYGDVCKGGIDKKTSFLLLLVGKSESADVESDSFLESLKIIVKAFLKSQRSIRFKSVYEDDCDKLGLSLLHDLIYKNERRKATYKEEYSSVKVAVDEIESLILKTPLIESLLSSVLSHCFQVSLPNPVIIPNIPQDTVTSLSLLQVVFLNSNLPHELRQVWRPLFNTDTDGESFSKFAGAITNQGPTLIIVTDESGNIFGGFATDSWKLGPKFVGKPESFLFHLHPKLNIYDSTPFNTNFQYFNLKQKTMPNGLGMGGQLEYFGFWIDNEFGIIKTSPSCSTYHSPQMGDQDGKIRRIEVFGVGELKEEDMDAGPSVLDMDPEAQAVLEMMGKTFHSKVIREVDDDQERKEQLEKQFES